MSEQSPTLSREEKIAVVSKVLSDQDQIHFADDVPEGGKDSLRQWFIESLVDIMPDEQTARRRDPAARFIFGKLPVVLHTNGNNDVKPIVWLDEQTLALQVNQYSKDNFETQLNSAHDAASDEQLKNDGEDIVAETDSAPTPKDEEAKSRQRNTSERLRYNPQAKDLPNYSKKHTLGDLGYYARMRLGSTDYDGLDTKEFENSKNISRNTYEKILEKGGGRWLWEYLHHYLLSDEALASKSPSRWFRDMCVMCGISTNTLKELTENHSQQYWHQKHNTQNPYSKVEFDALRMALSIHLKKPVRAGYGLNTGAGIGYYIPAGSAFGLPVITQEVDEKVKTIVEPDAVEGVLRKLFVERKVGYDGKEIYIDHYHPPFDPAHTLRQIKQTSDAWREGKLTRDEVIAAKPIKSGSKLHQILKYVGLSYFYPENSHEYSRLTYSLNTELSNDISSLCTTLDKLNEDKWHISKEEFAAIIESLCWLPASQSSLFHTDEKRSPDKVWEFTMQHHNGKVGKLLATYRELCGYTVEDLANRIHTSRQNITQYESGIREEIATINRALSKETKSHGILTGKQRMITIDGAKQIENLWLLPTEPNDPYKIRADVVEYLEERKFKEPIPPPSSHWVGVMDALAEVAGVDYEAEYWNRRESTRDSWVQKINRAENPIYQHVQSSIIEALAPYEGEPLPLIELGGQEYLVKRGEHGEVLFQNSDIERLRPWLLEQAQASSASHERRSQAAAPR